MIQKKICMLGAFAVGKTSLVSRFVRSLFSEKYHSTVGVKIDKQAMRIDEQDLTLMLWDIAGEDEFQKIHKTYLRGASGYLLIVDGTRGDTLETAASIRAEVESAVGALPFVVVLNKADLAERWEVDDAAARDRFAVATVLRGSAKTGEGVEEAFETLARSLLG